MGAEVITRDAQSATHHQLGEQHVEVGLQLLHIPAVRAHLGQQLQDLHTHTDAHAQREGFVHYLITEADMQLTSRRW